LLFTGSLAPVTIKEISATIKVEEVEDEISSPRNSTPSSSPLAAPEATLVTPLPPDHLDENISSPTQETRDDALYPATGIHPLLTDPLKTSATPAPKFVIEQLGVDRRLIVNRKRQLKMYRVWMQGKFRKLVETAVGATET